MCRRLHGLSKTLAFQRRSSSSPPVGDSGSAWLQCCNLAGRMHRTKTPRTLARESVYQDADALGFYVRSRSDLYMRACLRLHSSIWVLHQTPGSRPQFYGLRGYLVCFCGALDLLQREAASFFALEIVNICRSRPYTDRQCGPSPACSPR